MNRGYCITPAVAVNGFPSEDELGITRVWGWPFPPEFERLICWGRPRGLPTEWLCRDWGGHGSPPLPVLTVVASSAASSKGNTIFISDCATNRRREG
jgi:hypothetical protein